LFGTIEQSRANGALIAAAPDMLAALKAALAYVRDQWVEDRPGVMETLEAAIALAEGRQP